jgi:NAD(P)-dependent dehydrogenase (short-subunit alcohol dehydrogenase family)
VIGFVRGCSEVFAPDVRVNCIASGCIASGCIASGCIASGCIASGCIAPGLIDTGMAADVPEDSRQAFIYATPMKRLGRPEEVAEMAAFLLSARSSFTSDQLVVASSGRITIP